MPPAIFLFMVMALAKSLEKGWSKSGIDMIEIRQHTHSIRECEQLTNHKRNKLSEGYLPSLFCILYVTDGAFTFATREQLKTGIHLIYSQFKRFMLEMHIGRGSEASNTECGFFHYQYRTHLCSRWTCYFLFVFKILGIVDVILFTR